MFKTFFLAMACLFALSPCCFADGMSAVEISKALPKSYSGTYVWENSGNPWNASVSSGDVKVLKEGTVQASGTEHFVNTTDASDTYDSDAQAAINAQTLSFEMKEIYHGTKEGFVPMVYKRKISSDLKNIDAEWISPKGEKVKLILTATAH